MRFACININFLHFSFAFFFTFLSHSINMIHSNTESNNKTNPSNNPSLYKQPMMIERIMPLPSVIIGKNILHSCYEVAYSSTHWIVISRFHGNDIVRPNTTQTRDTTPTLTSQHTYYGDAGTRLLYSKDHVPGRHQLPYGTCCAYLP